MVSRALTAAILLALAAVPMAPTTTAQDLVVRGGPSVLTGPSGGFGEAGDLAAHVHAGARFWLTNIFQAQVTVGYDDLFTGEVSLLTRPLGRGHKIEPYMFVGIGFQFGGEQERAVVPAGIGAQYEVSPSTAVFLELGGRWHHRIDPAQRVHDLDFHVAPTVGAVYRFVRRPPPLQHATRADWVGRDRPMVAEDTGEGPAIEEALLAQAERPREGSVWESVPGFSRAMAQIEDDGKRIRVPDGTFVMGLADEDPLRLQAAGLRRVTVSSFYIDKMEVSNRAYKEVLAQLDPGERSQLLPDAEAWERARSTSSFESYYQSGIFDNFPVVAVSWQQAARYCELVNGRLPTEAEWEYAARSGQPGGIYPWPGFETRAPDGTYLANYNPGRGLYAADGYAFTAPVDAFLQTPWGMYNVAGNVSEWVADAYAPSLAALSDFNPLNDEVSDGRRVIRGGSWASDEFFIGVGVRDAQQQNEATIYTGFRCAYDIGHADRQIPQTARDREDMGDDGLAIDPSRQAEQPSIR